MDKLKSSPCVFKGMAIFFSFLIFMDTLTLLKDDKMPFYKIAFSVRGMHGKLLVILL